MKLKFIAAIAAIAIVPLAAQAQPKPAAGPKPTKAEAQRVVQGITADKAKSQKYCELASLSDQLDQAEQKKDNKKLEELSKKADDLMNQLGPDYAKLMDGLQGLDPDSKDGKEIGEVLEGLDKACGK